MMIDRHDFKYILRSARRTPLLTAVVVVALSIGIGLNVGVFSVLDFIFFEPPTKKDPASFVQIFPLYEGWLGGQSQNSSFTFADFDAVRTRTRSLTEVAGWESTGVILYEAQRHTQALLVTCNYFQVFGIDRPLLGRFFRPEECAENTSVRVAVLGEHLWRNLYSSDPHIVGKVIHLNRQAMTVIGVGADRAANAIPGGIWIPYTLQPDFNHGNSAFQDLRWPWLSVAGRLRPGFSRSSAQAELEAIFRQRDQLYLRQKVFAQDRKTSLVLTDGSLIRRPAVSSLAGVLLGLILGPLLLVLLLACTNTTMLFLSRSIARRAEVAVRLALGAGRGRLLRMLVSESLLTAAMAGAVSLFLAQKIPHLLFASIDPEGTGPAIVIEPNWTIFIYLAFLVAMATVASSLAPMRESMQLDLITALKSREGAATRRSRTTGVLIVAQIAMSFVLLAAAVLFARMPSTMTGIDTGFETRQTMGVPLEIDIPPYTAASALNFYRTLESRILTVPGVQSFAYMSLAPFQYPALKEVRLEGQNQGQGRPATIDDVSAGFFATFGVSLLRGRSFQSSDVSAATSAPVAVVSAAFARAFWGGGDPLGKIVVTSDDRHLLVVGVARDLRSETFGVLDGPRLYTLRSPQSLDGQLYVRFTGDAAPVATGIARAVQSLDSTQVEHPSTLWDSLEENATGIRSLARIILFMAGTAVLLALTGIYSALTFAIQQRTREFGIQMTLGATRGIIFRSVTARGLRQIAAGLCFGLALAIPAAWAFARLTARSPLHVEVFDLPVYTISALLLAAVSLAAMCIPSLRATRVDPMTALRNE
jgi:predicted permease